MKPELDIDFCNGFFYTLAEEKSLNSMSLLKLPVVFFKFICRWFDMPLGGTDNEALPGCVYDFLRHPRQRIDLHHAGDLRQQTMQQTEIAARDPDDGR